jgi:iron-sulfur cluster repair protein YtfE (RIC family)
MPAMVEGLLREHRRIEEILMGLQFLVELKKADPIWRMAELDARRGILTNLEATLNGHLTLEETDLFPRMREKYPALPDTLSSLAREHDDIRAHLSRLLESSAIDNLQFYATRLAASLRDHFYKEERVLFPMASMLGGR